MANFKSQLKQLTLEQKQKAFSEAEKYFNSTKKTPDEEGKLVLITEQYYQKALEYMRRFIREEPVERASGVHWNDEVEQFWLDYFRYNISLMLLADDGDVMAIRVSKFLCYNEVSEIDAIKTPELRLFALICHKGGIKADFFGHFGAKECIQFFGLGTNEKYRHQHLATRIMKTAIEMAKHLGVEFTKGEGSNFYSKRIYKNLGFELLHEEFCKDFEVDGVKPLKVTGENISIRYFGYKIPS